VADESLTSVIVPVFNGERFLAEALRSVLDQDHRPIEVIVIDDGSTDHSAEIAGSSEHVVLIRQANLGPAAARNAGLARATGSFFTFLDADDRMAPGRITTQLEHLAGHPDTGCVAMSQELILEPGMTIPTWLRPMHAPDEVATTYAMSAMIRRAASERVGGFDESYRFGEDLDWFFRMRELGIVVDVLPQVGTFRRIHTGNLSWQPGAIGPALLRSVRERIERGRTG
jgi:glycosyltransferase involved in cell wall biosynthesis